MRHFRPAENSLATLRAVITVLTVFIISVLYYYIHLKVVFISGAVIARTCPADNVHIPSAVYVLCEVHSNGFRDHKVSGVFIKFHQSVKYSSIQYAAVIRTPLSDVTGLNFVVFFVFGDT